MVLGKVAATSLETALRLLAALPLVAIPFLIGGISLPQFALTALATWNLMFLSLAIGVCVSAYCVSGRTAVGVTFGLLAFLTLGFPIVGEEVFNIRLSSREAPFFYMLCPLYTMEICLDRPQRLQSFNFLMNMAGIHALGWVCLLIACRRTRDSWREMIDSPFVAKWRDRFTRWSKGAAEARRAWRTLMLDQNPVGWLEGRDRLQIRVLWILLLASGALFIVLDLAQQGWPDDDFVILWGMFSHYIFCLWVALQSPRRLADDKQSGALELLLCTPMHPKEIVRGTLGMLIRRFGWAYLMLLAIDAYLMLSYLIVRRRNWDFHEPYVLLSLYSLLVCPLQVYAFAHVGVFQGLAQANSTRASAILVGKLGVLPWCLFIVTVFALEFARRQFNIFPRMSGEFAFAMWTFVHVLVCGFFVGHAHWHLSRNFHFFARRTPRSKAKEHGLISENAASTQTPSRYVRVSPAPKA